MLQVVVAAEFLLKPEQGLAFPLLDSNEGFGSYSVKAPSLVVSINSATPQRGCSNTSVFVVSQETNQDRVDCLVTFQIPEGSRRCQLELDIPLGYPVQGSNNSRIDFWTVEEAIPSPVCWDNAPFRNSPVGVVQVQPGAGRLVIDSFHCKSTLRFRACMEIGPGMVSFRQEAFHGLMMEYG